ncbi:MAG: delta-aminolevulinic acid dehydratase [Bacteroidetes bacterium RIFCSPHIGHO2_02_FULL_44_7]|nr:MAG: delta-aminolevulinic acid dehydratase [Bacteroidetes bacterium RIFCSPHIGHO2_02_FULL_44_7]
MEIRPRRNRKNTAIRDMVQETRIGTENLIYPFFLEDGRGVKKEIVSLPGNFRWSLDLLLPEIELCMGLGLNKFVLFPAVSEHLKDRIASYSYADENYYLHVIRAIKERFPDACLMSDVAMDPYSSDGHDGLVENGRILNDESLPILARMALAQAQAGVDIIGPSDMMDGRVGYLRNSLDSAGYSDVSIMSYTAKYASAFYGPFREALDSAPKSGDKKSYQMNPANKREAILEALLDAQEGADMLMVKPALCYLDIIHVLKEQVDIPITAYNVSGECAMLYAASRNGWLDYDASMMEMLLSIRRAGADGILTYFAKDFALLTQ